MGGKHNISILYLGKRGGGAQLTLDLTKQLSLSSIFELKSVAIRKDNEIYSSFNQSVVIDLLNSGLSMDSFLKIFEYLFNPQKLLCRLRIKSGEVCLIPMISPVGLVIERILKRQGIHVLRFLHDAHRHPGDRWPTNRIIRRIISDSTFLITLSINVANQILMLNSKIDVAVYNHPPFNFPESSKQLKLPEKYYLFLGRIRKYKGLEIILSSFRMMNLSDVSLVIAGEGKVSGALPNNVFILNRWLEESEISELVKYAEVICFPYVESSQSGLIPYCMIKNKKIAITPTQGLKDQVKGYPNVVISSGYSPQEFKLAMESAFNFKKVKPDKITLGKNSLEKCLLESPYFVK